MRRRLTAALVAVLAAAGVAGAAPLKVITHYHWSGQTFDQLNTRAAAEFMARNPGVEVKMFFVSDANAVKTVLAAGKPIDTFGLSHGESAEFLAAGQMVPIIPASFGKASISEVLGMWNPGAVETCGGYWDHQYYGIPFELSNYVGWVNVSDMKEAGLDPARDKPRTWDQFVQVARKLAKVKAGATVRNGFMCDAKEGIFNFLVLLAMMEQLGLDWGSEKGLVSSMDRPDILARGLRTYTDFVTVSRIWDPAFADNDRLGFAHNKTAMFLTGGAWYLGLLEGAPVPRTEVEPFPYPRFPDGRDVGGVGYGYCVYVSQRSKDPALAFRFLDALASQPNEFIRYGYYQPRRTLSNGAPALDPTLARKYIPYYDEVFHGELAKTAVWLSSTRGSEVTDLVWQAITRVIYGGISVEDSVRTLQGDIRGLFPNLR